MPSLEHYFVILVSHETLATCSSRLYEINDTPLVTERVGRKWALQISVFVFIIGAILMTVATNQLGLICEYDHLSGEIGSKLLLQMPDGFSQVLVAVLSLQQYLATLPNCRFLRFEVF